MTVFASFNTANDAERAAAAILDRGGRQEDVSIVSQQHGDRAVELRHGETNAEAVAKHGLTTTTGADAAMGAAKGLSVGMGLGILGALAALLVPGVGLVVGGGALAAAFASTAAAVAVAGGIVGYLKDQGMGEEVAAQYHARIAAGGAILSVQIPTGDITEIEIESLLVKYGAVGVFTSYPSTTQDVAPLPVAAPHVVPSEPLETLAPVRPTVAEIPVTTVATAQTASGIPVAVPTTTTVVAEVPANPVITHTDPVTGLATQGYVDDPTTGLRRPVRFEGGRAYYDLGLPAHPIPPVGVPVAAVAAPAVVTTQTVAPAVAVAQVEVPVAAVTPTRSDPVTGLAVEGFVEDPVTGLRRPVRFEHGRAYYVG